MKFILGEKLHMTQIFDDEGRVHPATVIVAAPATVTQVKTADTDGYGALQIGSSTQKEHRVTKPVLGHMKKAGGVFKRLREVRLAEPTDKKVGDSYTVADAFQPGDKVSISAVTKGKGFQGVVKRHGFHGGWRSHGDKHTERAPGSIGMGGVQRVFKGKRMGGRMGGNRVTLHNVTVLLVDKEQNRLVLRGSIPGRRGTLVEIRG
jgi:large subunit ribosomal protein L3